MSSRALPRLALLGTLLTACAQGSVIEDPDASPMSDAATDGARGDGAPTMCMRGAPDEPDRDNVDSNCDGIDGDVERAVFVAADGNDQAIGTREMPVRTLRAALALANRMGRTQVLVAGGMYTETATLRLSDGISIYGGYDRSTWQRGANMTTLQGATVAIEALGLRRPTTLARVVVRAADATGGGEPSIALRAVDAAMLTLNDGAQLAAGRGGNGSNGSTGMDGAEGAPGGRGGDGAIDNQDMARAGAGGRGGENPLCPQSNGGSGGRGGYDPDFRGSNGTASSAGVAGGGGGDTDACTPVAGRAGSTGASDGRRGMNGMGGANVGRFDPMTFAYQPANGTDGSDGENGAGGGGGGGSSGQTGTFCVDGAGNGGGGGGAGGCGGTGGRGGMGGGASVGVLAVRSPFTLDGVTISTGGGGNGGAGGAGGSGGAGGMAGAGGAAGVAEIGMGGAGGAGRRGGEGGAGGGGGGGPSVGIWAEGMAPRAMNMVFRVGQPGMGGVSPGGAPAEGQRGIQRETQP